MENSYETREEINSRYRVRRKLSIRGLLRGRSRRKKGLDQGKSGSQNSKKKTRGVKNKEEYRQGVHSKKTSNKLTEICSNLRNHKR